MSDIAEERKENGTMQDDEALDSFIEDLKTGVEASAIRVPGGSRDPHQSGQISDLADVAVHEVDSEEDARVDEEPRRRKPLALARAVELVSPKAQKVLGMGNFACPETPTRQQILRNVSDPPLSSPLSQKFTGLKKKVSRVFSRQRAPTFQIVNETSVPPSPLSTITSPEMPPHFYVDDKDSPERSASPTMSERRARIVRHCRRLKEQLDMEAKQREAEGLEPEIVESDTDDSDLKSDSDFDDLDLDGPEDPEVEAAWEELRTEMIKKALAKKQAGSRPIMEELEPLIHSAFANEAAVECLASFNELPFRFTPTDPELHYTEEAKISEMYESTPESDGLTSLLSVTSDGDTDIREHGQSRTLALEFGGPLSRGRAQSRHPSAHVHSKSAMTTSVDYTEAQTDQASTDLAVNVGIDNFAHYDTQFHQSWAEGGANIPGEATDQSKETDNSSLFPAPLTPRRRVTDPDPTMISDAARSSLGGITLQGSDDEANMLRRLRAFTMTEQQRAEMAEVAERKRAELFYEAAHWVGSEDDFDEWMLENVHPADHLTALMLHMRDKLNVAAHAYSPSDKLPLHPKTSKGWNHKNLRCTICPEIKQCPICNDSCCARHALKLAIEKNSNGPNANADLVQNARHDLNNIDRIYSHGAEVPTFLFCSTCCRRVCPKCCGQCPDEQFCKDIQCKDCKENPWEICEWHVDL